MYPSLYFCISIRLSDIVSYPWSQWSRGSMLTREAVFTLTPKIKKTLYNNTNHIKLKNPIESDHPSKTTRTWRINNKLFLAARDTYRWSGVPSQTLSPGGSGGTLRSLVSGWSRRSLKENQDNDDNMSFIAIKKLN